METNVFFPNKICCECAKQLLDANEFLNRCNTLASSFHKCIEQYKDFIKEDNRLPSLEAIFVTKTHVTVKQEVEPNHDSEDESFTSMPFTEVFVPEERMELEDTKFVPKPTTSNYIDSSSSEFDNVESIEAMPVIPGELFYLIIFNITRAIISNFQRFYEEFLRRIYFIMFLRVYIMKKCYKILI